MTFTRKENPGVFPAPEIELTLAERDPQCSCPWVVARYRRDGGSLFKLKYRHGACRAYAFHRRLDERTAP